LQTGAELHVNCGYMVEIETGSRIERIQCYAIPEPRATLQGNATWRIQCHVIQEPKATLQGAPAWRIQCYDPRATLKVVFCRILLFLFS